MLQSEAPSVRPEIVFTEDILEEIGQGNLRIPRFQRPFVWKPADMLNLFDSIYRGYPIGSVLIWDSTEPVQSLDKCGPLPIPGPQQRSVSYILDGQQRLSTLFACLRLPRDFPLTIDQEQWKWWVWFDLKTGEFTHVPDAQPAPWLLPMRSMLRTVEFLSEARRLQAETPLFAAEYITEAEQIAQKIKNYKLATVRIRGGTLGEAVDIFSRLNSKGRIMSPDQMISALTYREGPKGMDLARRIDLILDQLSDYDFGQVDRQMVFRSILAAGGHDIHSKEWNALAANVGGQLDKYSEAARTSLISATRFLKEEIGVISDKYLPYSYQMLLLSEFFRLNPHPNPNHVVVLRRWFWSTSLSGWFAGANTTNIDNAITEMRRFACNEISAFTVMPLSARARPYPRRFDARSARVRALLIFMLTLQPRDPRTGAIAIEAPSHEGSRRTFQQVFPNLPTPILSDPANRVLVERSDGRSIRDLLRSLPNGQEIEILKSHAIPWEAYNALMRDQGQEFVQIRSRYLAAIEQDFMFRQGVSLPVEQFSDSSETDSDATDETMELSLF